MPAVTPLVVRTADMQKARLVAALSATRKEERKNEKEEGIYFINRPVTFRTGCKSFTLWLYYTDKLLTKKVGKY